MHAVARLAFALLGPVALSVALLTPTPSLGATPGAPRLADLPQRWRDDDGQELVLSRLTGQRVVLTMAYASCHRTCPLTIAALEAMQRRLDARGEQAHFIVVGYDPVNDDPVVWHQYRRHRHLDHSNWHFLTGSPASTARLARALGFDFWMYDEHVMHGSRVLVFDAAGTAAAAFGPETPDWAAAL